MKLVLKFSTYGLAIMGALAAYDQLQGKVPGWAGHLMILFIMLALLSLAYEVNDYFRSRPKMFPPNSQGIANTLCELMNGSGKAVLFSRDLTWASQTAGLAFRTLADKAHKAELTVLCEVENGVAKALSGEGAAVYSYAGKLQDPGSRFTIFDFGKPGARLVIGYNDGKNHVIREYTSARDPALIYLAEDMIKLAIATGKKV